MLEYETIDPTTAAAYLRRVGWLTADEPVTVERLAGGVSNEVLYVARSAGDFVVKQALPQLRTPTPWFSSVERIWREVDVLRTCAELVATAAPQLTDVTTPAVLHEDRHNYTFAMSAAPRLHRVWKRDLLGRRLDGHVAQQCGRLLAALHGGSYRSVELQQRLGDRQLFYELRLDPYYRAVAAKFPDDAPVFERLIAEVWEHPRALVHADFTPKNLLVWDTPAQTPGLMMVDFETGHFGDPAFDLGLFVAHIALKASAARCGDLSRFELAATDPKPVTEPRQLADRYLELARQFWETYVARMATVIGPAEMLALEARGVGHLAGCVWARLDGKSRVEYLVDHGVRENLRSWSRRLLYDRPGSWVEAWQSLAATLDRTTDG